MLTRAAIAAGIVLLSGSSRAADSPFELRLGVDLSVAASAFALMVVPPMVNAELGKPHCDPCDPARLNALDRSVVGYGSTASKTASDIELFSLPAVATGLYLLDLRFGWQSFWQDLMMIAQVVLITGASQQLISVAVRRPRPFMYTPGARADIRADPESARSFFSGHAATAFGLATSFAYVFTKRRPQLRHPWLVWVASLLVAAPMPVLRVAAGEHFWTDVIAGAALGASVGLLVPTLHLRRLPAVALAAGNGTLGLRGRF